MTTVVGFDSCSEFLFTDGSFRTNVIISGPSMRSSVHIDNKYKDILILCEGPTQGLNNTTLVAEAKYPINFTQSKKRFVLTLHYNRSNSFSFVNATKFYQFKAKYSEIKNYATCLGSFSNDFQINNVKNRNEWNFSFFSVTFNSINTNDILDANKYLMKKT